MNEKSGPLLIGGNAHIRLQLYEVFKADIHTIEQARLNVLNKLRTPEFASADIKQVLAMYEKEKEILAKKKGKIKIDGLIGVFDKSKNI